MGDRKQVQGGEEARAAKQHRSAYRQGVPVYWVLRKGQIREQGPVQSRGESRARVKEQARVRAEQGLGQG